MTAFRIDPGDVSCRYLAAPESSHRTPLTPFATRLKEVGIKLPETLSLRIAAARGWLRPRLRVAIPIAALRSWRNFPEQPMDLDDDCPAEDIWGQKVWRDACQSDGRDTPIESRWMHWLDDGQDPRTVNARKHALDPVRDSEPAAFDHPHGGPGVLPWIDFFADWQVYPTAELVRSAVFTLPGVTDEVRSVDTHLRERAREFDGNTQQLAKRWEKRGAFLDVVGGYRTILARCCRSASFCRDVRASARSFAAQRGIDATEVKRGIRDVLLRIWQSWTDAPPTSDRRLMLHLQQDIVYAVRLWRDLSGESVDPFDPFWHSTNREPEDSAMLVDAIPHEEWLARRDFVQQALHYQRYFPHPYQGEQQFAGLLAQHWDACPPLRRFCLAWVRLHDQLRSHDVGRYADQPIAANERIEQFNLAGLHTERVLRHVHTKLHKPEPEIKPIVRAAVERSVRSAAKTHLNAAGQRLSEMLEETKLHQQRSAVDLTIPSAEVGTGSTAADQLVAAHLNALILRNYAAHHDYLDDELIFPSRDEAEPHAGATLLSSCLLVVIAALHSLPPESTTQP